MRWPTATRGERKVEAEAGYFPNTGTEENIGSGTLNAIWAQTKEQHDDFGCVPGVLSAGQESLQVSLH